MPRTDWLNAIRLLANPFQALVTNDWLLMAELCIGITAGERARRAPDRTRRTEHPQVRVLLRVPLTPSDNHIVAQRARVLYQATHHITYFRE